MNNNNNNNNNKTWLPDRFLEEMKELLGDEYEAFIASYEEDYNRGMRCNTLKIHPEKFEKMLPIISGKVSWTENGYYVNEDEQPAKHPYYFAGLYYIQEPSAMLPAAILPIEQGDKVLDLCAAPGGKTTELGARLNGTGLLISNDISASRAKALVKNIELFGIKNAIVVSETPERLAERFEGYFDKILVDAPCSGEGMFRKVHSIAKNWEQYGSGYYADIQRSVLPEAVKMLRPGGMMVYSTCTFSKLEDEDSLAYILENYPDMEIVDAIEFDDSRYAGFAHGIISGSRTEETDNSFSAGKSERKEFQKAVRIFPHRVKGEGHFVALLHKKFTYETNVTDSNQDNKPEKEDIYEFISTEKAYTDLNNPEGEQENKALYKNAYDKKVRSAYKKISDEAFDFFEKIGFEIDASRLWTNDDRVFMLPKECPDMRGLRVLRTGLYLGEMKKGRFEPSQSLALALRSNEYKNVLALSESDERAVRFLKCESIDIEEDEVQNGYCLVTVDGYTLGWGKVDKGRFKNKYLSSWRLQ